MPENNSLITIKLNDGRTEQWTPDQYEKNKEKLYEKFPDAEAVRTSSYNPEEGYDPTDTFGVRLTDGRVEQWTPDQMEKNYDRLVSKYPDAQVVKVSDMSTQYWKPKADEALGKLQALGGQNSDFERKYTQNLKQALALDTFDVHESPYHDFVAANKDNFDTVRREREELREEYFNNPWVKTQATKAATQATQLRDEYRTKMDEAQEGGERRDWRRAAKLQDDIRKIYEAPNKYVKDLDDDNGFAKYMSDYATGAVDKFTDQDFYTFGLSSIARNFDLRGIAEKIQNAGSDKDIDQILTPSEKAEIVSFYQYADAQRNRADSLSGAYTAGQSFADSVKFMAEFLLSTGVANAAGKALSGSSNALASWLGRQLMSERALNAAGQVAAKGSKAAMFAEEYLAKPIIQGLWHTGTQLSSLESISDALLDTDSNGNLVSVGQAIGKGVLDSVVENWSESFGGAIEKTLALPFQGLGWAGEHTIGKTGFGRLARWVYNSAPVQIFKEAGFNGMIGEIGEEWAGNAVRVGLGLMKPEEFKDFASWEQQLEMAASFAPMSMLGLGSSSIAAVKKSNNLNNLSGKVRGILERQGRSEEEINDLFNTRFDTAEDIGKKLAPYLRGVTDQAMKEGATAQEYADYRTILDFAKELGLQGVVDEIQNIEDAERRQEVRDGMEGMMGKFWQEQPVEEGQPPVETVRVVKDGTGETYYVVGVDENGLLITVGADGSPKFQREDQLEEDNTYSMDEFLQGQVDTLRKDREAARMNTERMEQIDAVRRAVAENPVIPMGTEEAPKNAVVVASNNAGVHVVWGEEGMQQEGDLTWNQVAQYLGTPIDVKTDAQLEEEAAIALDEARERMNTYKKIAPGKEMIVMLPTGEGDATEPASYRFEKAVLEDGQVMFYGRDEQGNSVPFTEEMVENIADLVSDAASAGGQNSAGGQVAFTDEEGNLHMGTVTNADNGGGFTTVTMADGTTATVETDRLTAIDDADVAEEVDAVEKYTDDSGKVNQNAFMEHEPEEWAKWNDTRRQDGGANTRERINASLSVLDKEIKTLTDKKMSMPNPDDADALEEQIVGLQDRRNRLQAIADGYAVAPVTAGQTTAQAQPAKRSGARKNQSAAAAQAMTISDNALRDIQERKGRSDGDLREAANQLPDKWHEYLTLANRETGEKKDAAIAELVRLSEQNRGNAAADAVLAAANAQASEEARRVPLRERARTWASKTGVEVELLETIDDVKTKRAKDQIEKESRQRSKQNRVTGWYEEMTVDGKKVGKVYIYLPNIKNEDEIDKTYIHEVISHKGLREMLDGLFDRFLDQVWKDLMDDRARQRFTGYILATNPNVSGVDLQRQAADEFVAFFSENVDLQENRTLWDKFVNVVRQFFIEMLGAENFKMTTEDLSDLLRASLSRYKDLAANGESQTLFRIEDIEDFKRRVESGVGGGIEMSGSGDNAVRFSIRAITDGTGLNVIEDDGNGNVAFQTADGLVFNAENHLTAEDLKNLPDTSIGYMVEDALALGTISEKQADGIWKMYADLLNMMLDRGVSVNGIPGSDMLKSLWEWEVENTVYKSVSKNADDQYAYSMDITRVCKKNEAVIKAISAMQNKVGYGLTPGQVMDIYLASIEEGYQVPCPVCYVFSHYINNGISATISINGQRRYGDKLVDPSTLTEEERAQRIKYWVNELNKQAMLNRANEKKITQAKEDIARIIQQIDQLSQKITSGELSGKERDAAIRKVHRLDKRYRAAFDVVAQSNLEQWIKQFAISGAKEKDGKYSTKGVDLYADTFQGFPPEYALDLRLTAETIEKYPAIQRMRKARGTAGGKEIHFASNNEIGEVPMMLGASDLKKTKNYYKLAATETNPEKRAEFRKKAAERFADAHRYAQQQSLRGGQRMWSWSDNIERLAPDVAMNLMQMQLLGGAVQSYSKQLEGVYLVASMGGYVNGSVMGYGKGYQELGEDDVQVVDGREVLAHDITDTVTEHTKDGTRERTRFLAKAGSPVFNLNGQKFTLLFDDVVGIDVYGRDTEAGHLKGLFELNDMLDKAGNIIVGMNDTHIRAALADGRIFFVIPWHASGNSVHVVQQMLSYLGVETDIKDYVDYTDVQEEKDMEGKEVKQPLVDFWEAHRNETDFACGIDGGIESGEGKGGLSDGQKHYRELRDAIFLDTLDQHPEWLEEIFNDAFLSQVYDKVHTKVDAERMTKGDTKSFYSYEYWDENSTYETADVNGARYLEYCRRLGYKPVFVGKLDGKPENDHGNFADDKGYWKLLIDRRMYDVRGNFQGLDATTTEGFSPEMVDPRWTAQNFHVTDVADDAGAERIADRVIEKEGTALPGGVPVANYDTNLASAVKKYDAILDEDKVAVEAEKKAAREAAKAAKKAAKEAEKRKNKTGEQILNDILDSIDKKSEEKEYDENAPMQFRIGDPSTEVGNTFFRINDGTLVGLHNISEEKLKKAQKAGGLANPSAAVIDITKQEHNNFGEISLVMPSAMVSATSGRNGGTYLGDAWTPTFPSTQKKMSKPGAKAFDKQIMALPSDVRYNVENAFENYLEEDRDGNALRWWFLQDTGRNPAIVHYESPFSEEDAKTIRELNEWEPSEEEIKTAADLFKKYAPEEDVRKATTRFDPEDKNRASSNYVRRRMQEYNDEIDKYGIHLSSAKNFLSQAKDQIRRDGRLDDYTTMDSARQFIEDNNLGEEFRNWLDGKEDEFGVETKLFAGWDRNGYKKWIDYTAENASKLMNKEDSRNAYSDNGLSATHALLVKKMRTLGEIKKNKDLLVSRAEYDERYDQVDKELHNAISTLDNMQKISDNPFTNYDYTASRLQEALTRENPAAYLNSEYKYSIPEDGEYAQQLQGLKRDIMEMPVNYFETKFNRPVGLNEFTSAVVPSNLDEKTRKILEDAGVKMFEYDPKQEGSRREATMLATEQEGIRFRITPEQDAEYMDAVESGDMEKAGQMVKDAFKAAFPNTKVVDENGEPLKVYHGTGANFTVFERPEFDYENGLGDGFYFTDDPKAAALYTYPGFSDNEEKMNEEIAGILADEYGADIDEAWEAAKSFNEEFPHFNDAYQKAIERLFPNPHVVSAYINIENPFDIEQEGITDRYGLDADDINEELDKRGGDGVIHRMYSEHYKPLFENIEEDKRPSMPFSQYMVRSSSQIKSADPVTYDDDGNVIPLSERFNPENEDIRFRFSSSVKEFNEMRDKAVAENGLVADGLNNVTFQIHPVTVNNYDGVSSEKVVEDFAKGKKFPIEDKHPDGFPFYISKDSLSEFVNKGQIDKSVEGGATRNIHLSLLPEMVDVIKKSIEAEIHPDYKKVGDERKPENGYNDDVLMHRLYGAIEAEGKVYRVKTTLKEYRDKNKDNKAYAYEVTKIELIDKPSDGVQKDSSRPSAPVNNSISAANLLKDVEKSYDPGKKLLEESEDTPIFRIAPEIEEPGTRFRIRTEPDPEKTVKVYKLMRRGENKDEVYPLYIDSSEPIRLKNWYDADSPAMKDLENLDPGYAYKIDSNGDVVEKKEVNRTDKGSITHLPSVDDVNNATSEGSRWITVTENKKGEKSYHNVGINGSGTTSTYAMRPGWHAGSLPTMRQIGRGKNKDIRDDSYVWVEGEVPADIDYQAEAEGNPNKDIPTHIPTDGYYLKATNADKVKSQADRVGWYVAGAFKPNRILGDLEAKSIIDQWNEEHPDAQVEYDYEREGGRIFNAETGELEEPNNEIRFSIRGLSGAQNANDQKALDNLTVATLMDDAGKDMPTIWRATGWEKGADGKWRNEIPDAKQKEGIDLKPTNRAGDILDAPELFKSYPQLEDIEIELKNLPGSTVGVYMPKENKIVADINNNTELEDGKQRFNSEGIRTILHELQHAIQYIEGFAKGGSEKSLELDRYKEVLKKDPALAMLAFTVFKNGRNSTAKVIRLGKSAVSKAAESLDISMCADSYKKAFATLIEKLKGMDESEFQSFAKKAAKMAKEAKKYGDSGYKKLAGEVEARNVERRLKLSDQKRADFPPSATEDVARNDQVVRFRMAGEEAVEKAREGGIDAVIGSDNAGELYMELYRAVPEEIRSEIATRAMSNGMNIRDAVEDYLSGIAESGEDRTGLLRLAETLLRDYAGQMDDASARYVLWRGNDGVDDGNILDVARDRAVSNRMGVGNDVRFRTEEEEPAALEDADKETREAIDQAKKELEQNKKDLKDLLTASKAMNAQKEYDKKTVEAVANLAKQILRDQSIDALSRREVSRLLGIVRTSVGKSPRMVKKNADAIVNVVIDHLLAQEKKALDALTKKTGTKTNATGVEVQGELDIQGQKILKAFKDGLRMDVGNADDSEEENTLYGRRAKLQTRLASSDDAVRKDALAEDYGLALAIDYKESVKDLLDEESNLRSTLKDLPERMKETGASKAWLDENIQAVEDSIRQNRIDQIEAYRDFRRKMMEMISGSVEAKKSFLEREEARKAEIQHLANSDMQGRPASMNKKPGLKDKLANSALVRFLAAPLATFDQMLRLFGEKSVSGEGYLHNRFMGEWIEATEKAYLGRQEAMSELDKKVSEVFGKDMRWVDLGDEVRKQPKVKVSWWDDGKMTEHELTQGQLLYIYMVNKMADGRMKLRWMGILDEDVDAIKKQLDPRFVELADWLQDEYLVNKRNKYNDVHERLFGASMAAIENYFPLVINKRDLNRNEDIGLDTDFDALPSSTTGAIIKRRKNNKALDLQNADAFAVAARHVEQMEDWAAFAEFNKDINALLSYKRFRNQVQNMASVYGSGNVLWKNFKDVARIAGNAYKPASKKSQLDTAAVTVAKGVTSAKITFRVYTALKQVLSLPAFVADANIGYLVKSMSTPWKSWNWAMENLPMFEKRWKSRIAGDTRLMDSEDDWWLFRTKLYDKMSKLGMSPNAFVDAVTVSVGAKAMYDTKKKQYLSEGFSEEQADKKAKKDATTLYNETQQSSEGAFVSAAQLDRTMLATAITVFRNSSMGFQRQVHDAIRNLGKHLKSGYKEESIAFMTKQLQRDGLTEEQARAAAERRYGLSIWKDATRVATFGFLVQFAWNLGSSIVYLLFGDDDDKKQEMLLEAFRHAVIGGTMEGLSLGNVASEALNMIAKGDNLRNYDPSLLPIISDMKKIYSMMGYDAVAGANELVNLGMQTMIGVNPQTFTDAIVAVVDACRGDLGLAREAMLLSMRVLQVPQSQIDEIYIDELGMTARNARRLSTEQMARRYAEYKLQKGAPVTGWAYSEANEQKRRKSYEKKFKTLVKERNTKKK